jgi:hypothetical protein
MYVFTLYDRGKETLSIQVEAPIQHIAGTSQSQVEASNQACRYTGRVEYTFITF